MQIYVPTCRFLAGKLLDIIVHVIHGGYTYTC
jgi:hypothetical protein